MKAWEFEHKLTADAVPPELHDDNEADWMAYTEAGPRLRQTAFPRLGQ